jgi:hypothetical protein
MLPSYVWKPARLASIQFWPDESIYNTALKLMCMKKQAGVVVCQGYIPAKHHTD